MVITERIGERIAEATKLVAEGKMPEAITRLPLQSDFNE
jgi:hypothetical protein